MGKVHEHEREINIQGVTFTVKYAYEKGEPQTYDYPGSPDVVEVYAITVGNDNQCMYDMLADYVVPAIEEELLELHEDE